MIRIANGQGFWGDLPQAPARQVRGGEIDVLCLEYLAEVTMGLLARIREKGGGDGYVPDVVDQLEPVIGECLAKDVTVVTSAGGLNPVGCARRLKELIEETGHSGTVAAVTGDDCKDDLERWLEDGEMDEQSQQFLEQHRADILAANRYLGSGGIVDAIDEGADVVVAGRVTDTALVLGPAMAEFDWANDEYDKLARAISAGHLLECGGQATGGNFAGKQSVPDLESLGFPITEIEADGTVTITKHDDLGGRVTEATVGEQLVYELTDPDEYLTPDVTVDFTGVELNQAGEDRVRVEGISGSAPPPTDKISVVVETGYQVAGHLTYCGPRPIDKAREAERVLRERLEERGATPETLGVETLGYDACHRELSGAEAESMDEVVFRVAASDPDRDTLQEVGKQLMGLILTGPAGATGFSEGRPRPRPVLEHHSVYRDRDQSTEVKIV